jgi:uncharacterized protein DUF5675
MLARSMFRLAVAGALLFAPALRGSGQSFVLTLERLGTCNEGETMGRLIINGREMAKTLELAWKNNEENISRAPEGTYRARIRQDGQLGWRIELIGVRDRSNIELHLGNFPSNTKGCVLVGRDMSVKGNTCATVDSAGALTDIAREMQKASGNGLTSSPLDISVEIK